MAGGGWWVVHVGWPKLGRAHKRHTYSIPAEHRTYLPSSESSSESLLTAARLYAWLYVCLLLEALPGNVVGKHENMVTYGSNMW